MQYVIALVAALSVREVFTEGAGGLHDNEQVESCMTVMSCFDLFGCFLCFLSQVCQNCFLCSVLISVLGG